MTRLRSLPLGVWLALGFALAVAAPTLSAGATWWAVGARQQADVERRLREATALIEQTGTGLGRRRRPAHPAARARRLRVEADLQLSPPKERRDREARRSELAPDGAATKQRWWRGPRRRPSSPPRWPPR